MSQLYKINCPECGKVQFAEKSMLQEIGLFDTAKVRCSKCDKTFFTVFNSTTNCMSVLQNKKGENE